MYTSTDFRLSFCMTGQMVGAERALVTGQGHSEPELKAVRQVIKVRCSVGFKRPS
jgi:hypothetical protein